MEQQCVKNKRQHCFKLKRTLWSACLLLTVAFVSGPVYGDKPLLMVFGDSLTAGYGLELEQAYPALLQAKADEAGIALTVLNAGLSGETTSGGLRRIDWLLRRSPDIFILALGANDGLRGTDPETTGANLRAIIGKVRARNPEVTLLLAGMRMPPNFGEDYRQVFDALYPRVAAEENVVLIPFLLEGVAGDPGLNLPDGIHPNAAGQEILAETVWEYLLPVLKGDAE